MTYILKTIGDVMQTLIQMAKEWITVDNPLLNIGMGLAAIGIGIRLFKKIFHRGP